MKKRKLSYLSFSAMTLTFFLATTAPNSLTPIFAQESLQNETVSTTHATQYERNPESTALFPDTLLNWDFKTDPNAIFNVSKTPLASRVMAPNSNTYQNPQAKVLSIAIVNRHTAGTPSQGNKTKKIYNFTNWQYIDTLVAWAGSAGEGIIVPPSGDITDVAHRNGVPILGTVFFPPSAYGGKAEWVREFVKKDANGNYVMADKLLEMTDAYGFDGWFINQETGVDSQTAQELKQLLLYLQNKKKPNQQIVWYDSMIPSGDIAWQGALTDKNSDYFQDGNQRMSDKMFIDFRWSPNSLSTSKDKAILLNRDPYDLYAGIDVQARGINNWRKPRHILDENGQLKMSIGLYVPDWTLRDGGQYDLARYWENEQKFWINKYGDPRYVDESDFQGDSWLGISAYVTEKTPITAFPFVTDFNVGNGTHYYQHGKVVQTGDFNNRSTQDILPTYRWAVNNGEGNQLSASFTYDDAFNGGSSVLLAGQMTPDVPSYINLYGTSAMVNPSTSAYAITKGDKKIDLVLSITDDESLIVIPSTQTTPEGENGWRKHQFSLDSLAGKTVTSIGLLVYGNSGQQNIHIGRLGIGDFQTTQSVSPVTNVTFVGKSVHDDLTESIRLSWQSAGENTTSYAIYRNDESGSTLVGTTANTAFTLIDQKRGANNPTYTVVPLDNNHVEHLEKSSESTPYLFETLETPKVSISANKTFVSTNETVTLTAKASPSTKRVIWNIPDAEIISETERTVTVKFKKAGDYTVSVTAENSAGQTTETKDNYISVYDETSSVSLTNLALLPGVKALEGSGYTNERESYRYAFDNKLDTKWCDNQNEHPYMIVDLGDKRTITGFELHHAQAGGESQEWNTKDYDILVSDDGQNWKTIVEHRNNTDAVTNDAISKIEARYVKLFIQKAESTGNTARIYEFKIFGVKPENIEHKTTATTSETDNTAALLDALREMYELIELSEDEYTKDSFKKLEEPMKKAKAILESDSPDADSIQEIIEELAQMEEHLVPKSEVPVFMKDGINVTLNDDKTLATFLDNDKDTNVVVKLPTALLDMTVQSLVVKKVPSHIQQVDNTLYDAYEIYFVDNNGEEIPLKTGKETTIRSRALTEESNTTGTSIKPEITLPISNNKKVVNVHLLTTNREKIVKPLDWEVTDDNKLIIKSEAFRNIAVEFAHIEEDSNKDENNTEKTNVPDKPKDAEKTNVPNKTEVTEKPNVPDKSEKTDKSEETDKSNVPDKTESQPTSTEKVLPQTGYTTGFGMTIVGFIISIMGLFSLKKSTKKEK